MIKNILFWCILLLGTTAATGQTAEVTSKGLGSILNNDVGAARDQAIDDALRKAVQEALGTSIRSETLVQNFQMVEDNILSWSRGYVSNYEILKEGPGPYDSYEVTIRAVVDLTSLENDEQQLRELLDKMGNPRVMLLIEEQNITGADRWAYFTVDMTTAENTMIEEFQNNGFEVIDPALVKENRKKDEIIAALSGDTRAAAAIAAYQDAEIIITGKAVSRVATGFNLGGMKSCQATVSARAVKADVARIIASSSERAAVPHIDEITGGTLAIEKASRKLATKLLAKITERGRKEFYNSTTLTMTVMGFSSYSELTEFINKLKFFIRGIKKIRTRNIAGKTAELDVQITGNTRQLARELEKKDFSPFQPEIIGLSLNKLRVMLKHQTAQPATQQDSSTIGME